jgi:ABC-2 type transport system permease protein
MKDAVALFVRAMLGRMYPRMVWMLREPAWLLQETLLPVLSVAAFAYVYRAMHAPEQYLGFAIIGGAMTAFWLNVLWSMGAQLYWERDSGNLELYVAAPAPMMAVLAGMALGGILTTVVRAVVILAAGTLLFGITFETDHWGAVIVVILLMLVALYGLGMVFSSAFLLWGREAWHIVNLLQEPVYLLSGINYPVKLLVKQFPLASIAALLPLTTGMDALRQLLFPGNVEPLLDWQWEIAILAALVVLFLVLAHYCLTYLESRARAEGRLTVKWQ